MGLVIPAGFDQAVERGEPIQLKGYFVHWMRPTEADEMRAFFEDKLTELVGQSVRIHTDGNAAYPQPASGGHPFMVAMNLVLAIVTICGAVVPYLMIEEKETHTVDALLVSPASIGQVVTGKALAGAFFGLTAAGVALAFNPRLVVHWEVAALTALCGTAFAVSLGLLLGSLFDNPQTMNLWFGGVLVAFSGSVPWGQVWLNLGVVLACAGLVLAVVVWRVRLSDR